MTDKFKMREVLNEDNVIFELTVYYKRGIYTNSNIKTSQIEMIPIDWMRGDLINECGNQLMMWLYFAQSRTKISSLRVFT